MWDAYLWVVIVGAIFAFIASYGIGANDVANAFATSVGAKSITLTQAIIIAGIFEFLGATLLGANVTQTITSGIADVDDFTDEPEILMYGMLCAITATSIWLLSASYLELPVSTTHSIIGGIIGFSLVSHGWGAVDWCSYDETKSGLDKFGGIVTIVASWFISPVLSGIIAVLLFLFVRTFILRSEHSLNRSFIFFPILVGITTVIGIYFIIFIGFDKQVETKDGEMESISSILGSGWTSLIAWILGIIVAITLHFFFVPWLRRKVEIMDRYKLDNKSESYNNLDKETGSENNENGRNEIKESKSISNLFDRDIHSSIDTDVSVKGVHEHGEEFDSKTEVSFSFLQVFTAACVSFAHGANDVANSIGPFAAIYSIYTTSTVSSSSDVPIWILLMGGAGIVVGLATYGYKVIKSIGVKLVKVTPSRGFAMELATATIIVIGSRYGIPLSTTHCQVGSTTAVGLVEGTKGVNYILLLKVFGGWIVTLIVVGITSALFFAQGIYSPSVHGIQASQSYEQGIGDVLTLMGDCLGGDTQTDIQNTLEGYYDDKTDNSDELTEYLKTITEDILNQCSI